MPPTGVTSRKRARQYEHIKDSAKKQGRSTKRAKAIAAATVNKQRSEAGETKRSRKGSAKKKASAKKKGSAKKKTSGGRKKTTSRKSTSRKTTSRKKR